MGKDDVLSKAVATQLIAGITPLVAVLQQGARVAADSEDAASAKDVAAVHAGLVAVHEAVGRRGR